MTSQRQKQAAALSMEMSRKAARNSVYRSGKGVHDSGIGKLSSTNTKAASKRKKRMQTQSVLTGGIILVFVLIVTIICIKMM